MNNRVFREIYSFGDRYAAITDERSITYNELSEICNKIGKKLEERNLIFHICSNSLGSFAGYTAFLNNNQVQMLLNEDMENEGLNQLILLYRPKYLYLSEERCGRFSCDGFLHYEKTVELYGYVLLKTKESVGPVLHKKLALLLTTSGSTGSPKYVRLSYQNVQDNAKSIVSYLELGAEERPITILPMWYTYGLSIINSHLLVGATLLISKKKVIEKEFWEFFNKNNATSISGTPYTYWLLYKMGFLQMCLPSLRAMTQAGGKLSEELHKKFAKFSERSGIRFYVMYGQTEATARMAYLPYQKVAEKCGSIGMAIPGGRLSLLDDEGNEIEGTDIAGEIVYYGSNVSMGYANCAADLEKGDERNGVLHTGDIGKRDRDGYYYIVGRKNRIIKMYGNRVSLDEMEVLIKDKFHIAECGCCGKDDLLLIYINVEDREFHEKVKEYIVKKIKINIIGIAVKYITKLPIDESGKVLYKVLEKI